MQEAGNTSLEPERSLGTPRVIRGSAGRATPRLVRLGRGDYATVLTATLRRAYSRPLDTNYRPSNHSLAAGIGCRFVGVSCEKRA